MALKKPLKPASKKVAKKVVPVKAKTKAKPVAKKVVKARQVGRPTLYKPEYCELATNYCLLGATDKQLSGYFNVDVSTLDVWKRAHPEFLESIEAGRDKADALIAKALYHRAKGYEHKEDDIRTRSVGGGRSELVITPTVKHYPPDTAAASLWLRNRQGKRWKEKTEVDHSGSLTLENMPDEVLADRAAEMMKRMMARPKPP